MTLKYIFFDLHGTLIDSPLMEKCYASELGKVLAGRYGGTAAMWEEANHQVRADWDSYYVDLDLGGDDGIRDMWEGALRTTRALFRLTGTPEPDIPSLSALSREVLYLATRGNNAFYADVQPVLSALHTAGYELGVASHAATDYARGTLEGGGVLAWFTGKLLCPDATGFFRKDADFFRAAGLPPAQCMVVEDGDEGIRGAKAAGMHTVQIYRGNQPRASQAEHVLRGDLSGLVSLCANIHQS